MLDTRHREIAQALERLAEASEAAGIVGCKQPAYRSPRASLQGCAQSRSELMSIRNARFCFARIILHPGKAHQVDAKSHG
jgi:DNA polymerase/3'-5' exonuclease PolX